MDGWMRADGWMDVGSTRRRVDRGVCEGVGDEDDDEGDDDEEGEDEDDAGEDGDGACVGVGVHDDGGDDAAGRGVVVED